MSDDLELRIRQAEARIAAVEADAAHRLAALRRELAELGRLVAAEAPEPRETPADWARDAWVSSTPEPPRPAAAQAPAEPGRTWSSPRLVSLDLADLLGARALAWAGGLVTLLGVVFFFVLAVDRGWIGEVARVSMGAAASLLVFGAGWWLRRRYGETHAALAAVGAGIAGGYATLLAAAALYDLLPALAALTAAAGIAALATATAIAWSSELVAGLGLVGAILVPAVVVLDGGLTVLGTAFAALVLAGAFAVAIRMRWSALLLVASLAAVSQLAALVLDADGRETRIAVLVAVFALLHLAAGLGEYAAAGRRLGSLVSTYAIGGAVIAGYGSAVLLDGVARGVAFAVVAATYLLLATLFFRGDRELSAFVGAAGLAAAGVAAPELASGAGVAVAWAAEAAVLAWLARRIDEDRYQVAAIAYLALAVGHVLSIDAEPRTLFTDVASPGDGIPAVAAAGAAALVLAWQAAPWPGEPPARDGIWRWFAHGLADLRSSQRELRLVGLGLAGLAAVYGGSLAIVAIVDSFHWAHVGVAGLVAFVAAGTVAAGAALGRRRLGIAGLAWAGACVPLAGFDAAELGASTWRFAWMALGVGILLAATTYQARLSSMRLNPLAGSGVAVAWLLALSAVLQFGQGWLLAPAAVFALAAARLRVRERDTATLLAAAALADAAIAFAHFLDGSALVLVFAAAGAGVALLGARLAESRLQVGAGAYLALGLAHALAFDAPPRDLFVENAHPGAGTQAVAFAAAGIAVLAWTLDGVRRTATAALAAALPVYAASLAILELSISFGDRSLDSAFQRGHTGVSALWGLVGLAVLTAGVARRRTAVRLGGFALFAVALAKLFLFDLAFLSSVTRAFSFLAVGAVLLAAGFLYQRLSDSRGEIAGT